MIDFKTAVSSRIGSAVPRHNVLPCCPLPGFRDRSFSPEVRLIGSIHFAAAPQGRGDLAPERLKGSQDRSPLIFVMAGL
ncbi:MAG: hypothetical protein ABW175_15440, partial [Bradyrhizobium sp.]